jgi:hypothetical protein
MKLETLMAVTIFKVVLRVMEQCRSVDGYQRFRGTYCLRLHDRASGSDAVDKRACFENSGDRTSVQNESKFKLAGGVVSRRLVIVRKLG